MNLKFIKATFFLGLFAISLQGYAQNTVTEPDGRKGDNVIFTAMPILMVSPDAKAGAMGETGVATAPDVNSIHWNPAKLAFIENTGGISASYSPWLKSIAPDVNLFYLSGFYRLDERNVLGSSLRYFSLGSLPLRNEYNDNLGDFTPNEFAFDISYARSFGENFSLGTALRYINSNIFNGTTSTGQDTKPGQSIAADVSGYYKNETNIFNMPALFALGLNISNIGTKMSYDDGVTKLFLPTNMRLGASSTFHLDDLSDFTVALDLNKLLAPTPNYVLNENRNRIDTNQDKSVPSAIFGSFSDAPGGFSEEMKEISYSTGIEYMYNKQFALRAGYFYENPDKGNRKYATVGAGFRFNVTDLNLSYVLGNRDKSPLAQTLRFSLILNFGQNY